MLVIDRFELNGDMSRTDFTRDYTRRRMNPPIAHLQAEWEQIVTLFPKFAGWRCD
jgi:hypothetical protein